MFFIVAGLCNVNVNVTHEMLHICNMRDVKKGWQVRYPVYKWGSSELAEGVTFGKSDIGSAW